MRRYKPPRPSNKVDLLMIGVFFISLGLFIARLTWGIS